MRRLPRDAKPVTTTILLVDDHLILRDGLRSLLDSHADLTVIGDAETGRQAISLARKLKPDVIIMDINMPELNGIEATRRIKGEAPDTKIISLSMYADSRFIIGMLNAGASDIVHKSSAFEELIDAIRVTNANRIYASPKITDVVLEDYVRRLNETEQTQPKSPLSAREREIVQLIAEGLTTKKIADVLHISPNTVETHRHHVMSKLNIRSIAELTKYAIREGITSIDE